MIGEKSDAKWKAHLKRAYTAACSLILTALAPGNILIRFFNPNNNMAFTKMLSGGLLPAALSLVAIQAVDAAMGPAFSTGPVADNTFIREAEATLVLPQAPSGNSGDASLWVGMGTSNGDLIQSIADNWQSEDWSVYAYTLLSTSGKLSD